nr:MAG TPA: hypothetical protein [Caudoviricetes sp.]
MLYFSFSLKYTHRNKTTKETGNVPLHRKPRRRTGDGR